MQKRMGSLAAAVTAAFLIACLIAGCGKPSAAGSTTVKAEPATWPAAVETSGQNLAAVAWDDEQVVILRGLMFDSPLVVRSVDHDLVQPYAKIVFAKVETGTQSTLILRTLNRRNLQYWQLRPGDQVMSFNGALTKILDARVVHDKATYRVDSNYQYDRTNW